jgi:hypothetical protein
MAYRIITIISLLAILLSCAPARAAEDLPSGTIPRAARTQLEAYRKVSLKTLRSVLTPMVEKTAKGEEFFGSRWTAESGRMVALLNSIMRTGIIKKDNIKLKNWIDDEIKAWRNIQKIGFELLDLHYRMASNVAEIEKDIRDSKAYYATFKDSTGKVNGDVGDLKDIMEIVAKSAAKNLKELGPAVDKLSGILGDLSEHSHTAARLIRQFQKRQFEFIKERGKLGVHQAALSKLKARSIDPDGTKNFAEFEKDWEASMTKMYDRYVKSVAEWKKVNAWVTPNQFYSTVKSLISSSGGMPLKFMTVGMPKFAPDDADEFELYYTVLRLGITDAIKKFKGEKWADIEKGLQAVAKERQMLRETCEDRFDAIEEEAGKRAKRAEEDYERVAKPMQSEYARLGALLAKERDEGTMRTLSRQMKQLKDKIDSAKRVLGKMQHLHLEEWRKDETERVYKEFRADLKKIDDRVAKYNKAKADLD